jgi:hypothetical protein
MQAETVTLMPRAISSRFYYSRSQRPADECTSDPIHSVFSFRFYPRSGPPVMPRRNSKQLPELIEGPPAWEPLPPNPVMIMRVPNVGSQYLIGFLDGVGVRFKGGGVVSQQFDYNVSVS